MLDVKIVNGVIVDGTGCSGFRGSIGIQDGRIVAIGEISDDARDVIDAGGQIVAPGFIDVHTHYDAQAFWDPAISPSCFHGVTTVVGGLCGFSIAPITPAAADYIKPMLARVEGIPLQTLNSAVPFNWSSFGEFLSRLDGNVGLNVGFFVGHSTIRRVVMGDRAVGEKATAGEIAQMRSLLASSLTEGGLGFSTTVSASHNDAEGRPVPSRWADREEFIALASVVSRHEGTGLEMLPDIDFGPGMAELMTDFSVAGNRPVNWNVLVVDGRPDAAAVARRQLDVSTFARERGGEIIALTVPSTPEVYMNLHTGVMFDALPGLWRDIFKTPVEERIAALSKPEVREQLLKDAATVAESAAMHPFSVLGNYVVRSSLAEKNKLYLGQKIGDIAARRGCRAIDALLDIAIADGLETIFVADCGGYDQAAYDLRGALWADDRTLIGASDAGAHLDLIDTFAFSTVLLEKGVREHGVISLEQAVHQITLRPATYLGLVDRGRIAKGFHADIVIFDPDKVGRGPTYKRFDLPGGDDFRLYADARGIDHVLVNGTPIIRAGQHTRALPGIVLRSGKDTRTVPMNALRSPMATGRDEDDGNG